MVIAQSDQANRLLSFNDHNDRLTLVLRRADTLVQVISENLLLACITWRADRDESGFQTPHDSLPGERIVVTGNFLIDAESNLRAAHSSFTPVSPQSGRSPDPLVGA